MAAQQIAVTGVSLDTHAVRVDEENKLMSWVTPQDRAFDRVSFLSWDLLLNRIPVDPANGLKVYFTQSEYDPGSLMGSGWPNNPAGKNAMLAESAALYYAYSGNRGVIDLVRALLDHQLQYGTTPAAYVWGNVPWSTARAGSVTYGNDTMQEGSGVLEPDKVGELGFHGYLRFWQITGDVRYRDAAVACADALVKNLRSGNATQSPWPFRVRAQDGQVVEQYGAHVIAPIRLLDELIRLDLGNVAAYQTTRQAAWSWLMAYPMVNGNWTQYFEDVGPAGSASSNLNQYVAGQTARYLLDHPETDSDWQGKVAGLISFIETNFGGDDHGDPGLYYGARVISEQNAYKYKMASHTSRFGAVNALYAHATGDAAAKDKAFRSLNWATYMARNNGTVNEGPAENANRGYFWFTDGHGDYVRHFVLAMGAFPEWAPSGENHLLRSSSVVKSISYSSSAIDYQTYHAASTEVFRVGSAPSSVSAGGAALAQRADLASPGWVYDSASGVLSVRHDASTQIRVAFDGSPPPPTPPTISMTSPVNTATGVATNSAVTVTFSEAMDATTITSGTFRLTGVAGAINATVSYDTTTRVATLTPSAALSSSTVYTATVTGGANGVKSPAGNALAADASWSFATAAAADTTPPTVTANTPASGATGVATSSTVTVTFSEAMDATTIGSGTFTLSGTAGAVNAAVSYNTSTRVATLTPSAALSPSTVYTATVSGGAAGVKDLAGNPLTTNRTWSLTTLTVAPPPVVVTAPVIMGSSVEGTTTDSITGTRSARIKANRVQTQAAATLTTIKAKVEAIAGKYRFAIYADNNGVPGVLLAETGEVSALTTGWQTYRLTSTLPVTSAQWYWIAVWSNDMNAHVYARSGSLRWASYPYSSTWPSPAVLQRSASFAYSIYAAADSAAADTTPPTVTANTPASGATGVATGSTVTVTFSEAMDATTIGSGTFTLSSAAGAVNAAVSYNTSTRVATLTPSAALSPSTVYTATVSGGVAGVKDLAGNPLTTNRTWSLTTSSTTPVVAPVVIMGSSSEGTTTDYITDANGAYINANRVQTQAAAILTTIKAKLGATSGTYRLAIYADNNGVPGSLLTETGEVSALAAGWQTYRLTSTLPVSAGQWYWIAIWSNDVSARVYAASGSLRWGAYPYGGTWPNVPVLPGGAPFAYSIYATNE